MELDNAQQVFSMIRPEGILQAVIIIIITMIAARMLASVCANLGERFLERRLILNQAAAFLRFGVYFVGIIAAAASVLDLSERTLLALSGTAGVALGFAFKDLAASVLAGITILIDKPFQVGDRISAGGTYGDVVAIGLRSVRIATLDDNLVTIPNSFFLNESVASGNAGELNMLVQMDFFIGMDQDVEKAVSILEEVLTGSRFCYLKKPWKVLVNQLEVGGHFAIRLRAHAYVLDINYEKIFHSDVTRRLLRAYRTEKILPPAKLWRSQGVDGSGRSGPVELVA